jgi:zinc protease
MASRLFERIREEMALAYFVRAARLVGLESGVFFFECGTQAARCEEVLAELRGELERVRAGLVTPLELERCRRRLITGRRMQQQTIGARAMQAGLNRLFDMPVNDQALYEAALQTATPERLQRFAAEWLAAQEETELVVLPEG